MLPAESPLDREAAALLSSGPPLPLAAAGWGLRVRAPGRLCPGPLPRPLALARGSQRRPFSHPAPSPIGFSRGPVGFVSPNFILPLGCEHLCPSLSLLTPPVLLDLGASICLL